MLVLTVRCSLMKIKVDQADKLFSQYIRIRDKKCLRCLSPVEFKNGLPVSHQASHFQGRGKEATRFDQDNVCTLCMGCHMYFTANPAEHYQWQVERLGLARVTTLVLDSNGYKKKDRKMEVLIWRQALKDITKEKNSLDKA